MNPSRMPRLAMALPVLILAMLLGGCNVLPELPSKPGLDSRHYELLCTGIFIQQLGRN